MLFCLLQPQSSHRWRSGKRFVPSLALMLMRPSALTSAPVLPACMPCHAMSLAIYLELERLGFTCWYGKYR